MVQNPSNNMHQEIFVLDGGGDDTKAILSGEGGLGMVDGVVLYVERRPQEGSGSSLQKRFEMEVCSSLPPPSPPSLHSLPLLLLLFSSRLFLSRFLLLFIPLVAHG